MGQGNHSYNHIQKLKPRVEQICRELGLQYATEENEGRIYINLTGEPAPQHLASQGHQQQQHSQQPYGTQPQYQQYDQGGYPGQQQQSYGGYQGQQQQYGGGQQQQNQEDEVEKVVKKLLPRLFKSCCVVM